LHIGDIKSAISFCDTTALEKVAPLQHRRFDMS